MSMKNVKVGDILVAISHDEGLGDYHVGDLIEVIEGPTRDAWVVNGQVDIKAFTHSWYKEENSKRFVITTSKQNEADIVESNEKYFKGLGIGVAKDVSDAYSELKTISTEQLKENLNEKYGSLGVARPDLETRKVGKNRIELVDKGFPNTLWEIARLMTKAQDVKQYKDHDWKNLPSDVFSSAASRHRVKHNMGELYDDEFEGEGFMILHKVNEAFNVLAELELLLTTEKNT